MVIVSSVKLDGEEVHVFNHAIYLFDSNSGITLELDMIVSEVVFRKYNDENNVIAEIELENGKVINSIMHIKLLTGKLPQINLFCDIEDPDDYPELDILSENDSQFPIIDEGITLEEIRQVEMPNEKVTIKVSLPIDQVEWLKSQKIADLSQVVKEMIKDYWEKYPTKNQNNS